MFIWAAGVRRVVPVATLYAGTAAVARKRERESMYMDSRLQQALARVRPGPDSEVAPGTQLARRSSVRGMLLYSLFHLCYRACVSTFIAIAAAKL